MMENMSDTYLENLEFNQLLDLVATMATFSGGQAVINGLSPLQDPGKLIKIHHLVSEIITFLDQGSDLGFASLEDVQPVLPMLKVESLPLDVREILVLHNLLQTAGLARKVLASSDETLELLRELGHRFPILEPIKSFIEDRIELSGEIPDRASPQLAAVRRSLRSLTDQIHQQYQKTLQRAEKKGILQDNYVTVRNNRYVIPLRADALPSSGSVVHGRSSSGLTVYVEPFDMVPMNNRFIGLQDREMEIIHEILGQISDILRAGRTDIETAYNLSCLADSLFSRARFARRFSCITPKIVEDKFLLLEEARHPLLEEVLRHQEKSVVPLSLKLTRDTPCLIISGPNTGGKTVALKTAGLLVLMAMSGIPVPARDMEFCLFHNIFASIGDQQSIAEDLSTFSSHVLFLRHMIEYFRYPSLILVDEIGTGTDPEEGSALAMAVLDHFSRLGAPAIVTTHSKVLKEYALTAPASAVAAVEIDPHSLEPTYKLHNDTLGRSNGLFIARKLGISEEIIQAANQHLSEKSRLSDGILDKLNVLVQKREEELASLTRMKHEHILKKIDQERRAEEKKRIMTRQLRKEFDQALQHFQQEKKLFFEELRKQAVRSQDIELIEKRSSRLVARIERELPLPSDGSDAPSRPTPAAMPREEMTEGMEVFISPMQVKGKIVDVDAKEVLIIAGNKKVKVPFTWVHRCPKTVDAPEKPPPAPAPPPDGELDEEIIREIKVIGKTVEEALPDVDRLLDAAFRHEISPVSIIHGMGRGILRRAIHEHLQSIPFVQRFFHPSQKEGGKGRTMVELDV